MNDSMPRARPPYLLKEITRHGTVAWYVRRGTGPRIRIRGEYGSDEFRAAYQAALIGESVSPVAKAPAGSLRWLVERYQDSSAWSSLALATRRQRENILKKVLESAGNDPIDRITRKVIVAGRERRKATPSMARHFVETMRGLFRWALDAELVAADPTLDVRAPKPRTEGHHTWTDAECDQFEAYWKVGTRERLAYDILLYTGQRRGDASQFGRQHIRDGIATVRTAKTGEVVVFRVLPPLAKSIEATVTGDLTFIVAANTGRPMSKEGFGNWFGKACREAGVPGSAHGLRKAGATRAANNGATVAELEALFGWRGGGMASLYTRKADREKLALGASDKLLSEQPANRYPRTRVSGKGFSVKNNAKSDS